MTTNTRTPPIFIRTPQPDIEERLVVVPPSSISNPQDDGTLTVRTQDARDATPADLARAGYAPLAAFVGPLDLLTPPTLAGVLEAIEGTREDADRFESERNEAREALAQAERELDGACSPECQARIDYVEADNAKLRAELARLTAPVDGEPTDEELGCIAREAGPYRDLLGAASYRDAYRLGVAHERARHVRTFPGLTEAAEQAFWRFDALHKAHFADADAKLPGRMSERDAFKRVACELACAHVRQERCLVAQAVALPGLRSLTIWREGPGAGTVGVRVNDCEAIMQAPADVPATLARLLGEVSRG